MPYQKKFGSKKNKNLYSFVREFHKGANRPKIIKKDQPKNTEYLIKKPDMTPSVHELLPAEEKISVFKNKYLAMKEVLCGEFIRWIAPLCAPKYRLFKSKQAESEEKEWFAGAKFNYKFVDSQEGFFPIPGQYKVNGYPFKNLTVEVPTDESIQHKEIVGLGVAAVFRYILGRNDCHNGNWGFAEMENHFQVMLVDFGECLIDTQNSSRLSQTELDEESQLITDDIMNLIRIVFENEENDPIPLPEEFYKSDRYRKEIIDTIEQLHALTPEELYKFIDLHLQGAKNQREWIYSEIHAGIEHLHRLLMIYQKNQRKRTIDEVEHKETHQEQPLLKKSTPRG